MSSKKNMKILKGASESPTRVACGGTGEMLVTSAACGAQKCGAGKGGENTHICRKAGGKASLKKAQKRAWNNSSGSPMVSSDGTGGVLVTLVAHGAQKHGTRRESAQWERGARMTQTHVQIQKMRSKRKESRKTPWTCQAGLGAQPV